MAQRFKVKVMFIDHSTHNYDVMLPPDFQDGWLLVAEDGGLIHGFSSSRTSKVEIQAYDKPDLVVPGGQLLIPDAA